MTTNNTTAPEITINDCPVLSDEALHALQRKLRDFLKENPRLENSIFNGLFRFGPDVDTSNGPGITSWDNDNRLCIRVAGQLIGEEDQAEIGADIWVRFVPDASRLADNIIARAKGEPIPHPELERLVAPAGSDVMPDTVAEKDLPTADVLHWLDCARSFFVAKGRAEYWAGIAQGFHTDMPPRPASLDAEQAGA